MNFANQSNASVMRVGLNVDSKPPDTQGPVERAERVADTIEASGKVADSVGNTIWKWVKTAFKVIAVGLAVWTAVKVAKPVIAAIKSGVSLVESASLAVQNIAKAASTWATEMAERAKLFFTNPIKWVVTEFVEVWKDISALWKKDAAAAALPAAGGGGGGAW